MPTPVSAPESFHQKHWPWWNPDGTSYVSNPRFSFWYCFAWWGALGRRQLLRKSSTWQLCQVQRNLHVVSHLSFTQSLQHQLQDVSPNTCGSELPWTNNCAQVWSSFQATNDHALSCKSCLDGSELFDIVVPPTPACPKACNPLCPKLFSKIFLSGEGC